MLGGAGDDDLKGGSDAGADGGADVLVGGDGKDKLDRGKGFDVLIGGMGKDDLNGKKGDDIVIGGYTSHDADLSALGDIVTEWTSADSYVNRVTKLLAGTGSTGVQLAPLVTVFDDDVKDNLKGDKDNDWFLADPTDDKIKDLKSGEILTDIDPFALQVTVADINSETVQELSTEALSRIFDEAVSRWVAAQADADSIGELTVQVANLPRTYLGIASEGLIIIDTDAAGYGWFIDATPADDSEFVDGPGPDGIDLLTVMLHELGHVLGHEHSPDSNNLMAANLSPAVRLSPDLDYELEFDHANGIADTEDVAMEIAESLNAENLWANPTIMVPVSPLLRLNDQPQRSRRSVRGWPEPNRDNDAGIESMASMVDDLFADHDRSPLLDSPNAPSPPSQIPGDLDLALDAAVGAIDEATGEGLNSLRGH